MSRRITIEEVTRVEGHGGIDVTIDGEKITAKFNVYEGPRFFESILKTVHYEKIPDLTRRICGICTASHSLASIGAIENAFDVSVSNQTSLLRDLLIHGEMIESHALHVFMLALPDYLGYPDAVTMSQKYPDAVKMALELKQAGNMIHNILSGREVHGMNERVGGFSKIPRTEELLSIKTAMLKVAPAAELAVELMAVENPVYNESKNILMAVDSGKQFGFIGDRILTSTGENIPQEDYRKLTNESVFKHSYAKMSSYNGSPFMVGALPRLALNHQKLVGKAATLYKEHNHLITSRNSVSNNLAQALELVHSVDYTISIIDDIVATGVANESIVDFDVYASKGVNVIEAPRGCLYHDYTFNEKGELTECNIITPTAQNVANIEKDLKIVAGNLRGESDEEIKKALELVVRAYDPCISCSVHLVKLK